MMDVLDAILSKPPQDRDAIENMLLQHDYPDEARKAAEKYAQLQAVATAARTLSNNLPVFEIGLAREVWGKTNTRIILEARQELAAALAALEQETK